VARKSCHEKKKAIASRIWMPQPCIKISTRKLHANAFQETRTVCRMLVSPNCGETCFFEPF
jgi:hypothetical protein